MMDKAIMRIRFNSDRKGGQSDTYKRAITGFIYSDEQEGGQFVKKRFRNRESHSDGGLNGSGDCNFIGKYITASKNDNTSTAEEVCHG